MSTAVTKNCGLCKKDLELCLFSINRRAKDGLHAWCKPCCRKAEQERYKIVREQKIKEVRAWQEKNLPKVKEYKKNWRTQQKAGPDQSSDL
jgi:hypothetical protein